MKVFYNTETKELYSVPNFDDFGMDDEEDIWKEDIDKIESDPENTIELEKMSTHQSFKIMEDFAETVDDNDLQKRLFRCLERKKPFANFESEVADSGDYRLKWFKFRDDMQIKFLRRQIEDLNE